MKKGERIASSISVAFEAPPSSLDLQKSSSLTHGYWSNSVWSEVIAQRAACGQQVHSQSMVLGHSHGQYVGLQP